MGTARRVYEYGGQVATGGLVTCSIESGGTRISGSSNLFSLVITNISGNSPVWIGSNTVNSSPVSGTGGILYGGASIELRVDNTADINVCAEVSGQKISWLGLIRQQ